MFKSYYHAMDESWVKPSQYVQDIEEIQLGGGKIEIAQYQVRLNENLEKNMAKI